MHIFRIYKPTNKNIAWLKIEEGVINIETGIKMVFSFLDYDQNTIEKNLFVIDGEEFSNLGRSGLDVRIAIVNKILEYTDSVIVKE
jgi:hypothetical protein